MVEKILKLAKEDYNKAVKTYGEREVNLALGADKTSSQKPEAIKPAPVLTQNLTESDIKKMLLDEITYPQLLKIITLLTEEDSFGLIKKQISKFMADGIDLADIGRSIYYIYIIEEIEYISKYGIGIVPNYLSLALKFFEQERHRIKHLQDQGEKIKNFKPEEIAVDSSNIFNKRGTSSHGVKLIDISLIGTGKKIQSNN